MTDRPVFTIQLQAEKGADAIRALRALLKYALRIWNLRCVSIEETETKYVKRVPVRADREETVGRWRDVA